MLEKNIRLIEYGRMVDAEGIPVLGFGKCAGATGMMNLLHGLGLRLLALGHYTPFVHIGPGHNYSDSETARQAVREAGHEIAMGRLPCIIGPLTFIFIGTGCVSQGARELFQELPHEYTTPDQLPNVLEEGDVTNVYGCVIDRDDLCIHRNGSKFDSQEFLSHPERDASLFSRKIAPYASAIINGISRTPNFPRLISICDAKTLLQSGITFPTGRHQQPHRLLAVCDIADDPDGSIEFVKECASFDSPFCLYDAQRDSYIHSFTGSGVLVCSLDNMPVYIARETTDFFGSLLLPYLPDMLCSNATEPLEEYDASPVIKNAVVISNGQQVFEFCDIF